MGSFKNMEMPCYVLFLISLFPKPWISQIKQDINLFFFQLLKFERSIWTLMVMCIYFSYFLSSMVISWDCHACESRNTVLWVWSSVIRLWDPDVEIGNGWKMKHLVLPQKPEVKGSHIPAFIFPILTFDVSFLQRPFAYQPDVYHEIRISNSVPSLLLGMGFSFIYLPLSCSSFVELCKSQLY